MRTEGERPRLYSSSLVRPNTIIDARRRLMTGLSVSILDAGRNSMSFFMLLVVSLGLSVMRESLGKTMLKCQALATAHFLFGST